MYPYAIDFDVVVVVPDGTGATFFGISATPNVPVSPTALLPWRTQPPIDSLFGDIQVVWIGVPAATQPKYQWVFKNNQNRIVGGSESWLKGEVTSQQNIPLIQGGTFMIMNSNVAGIYPVQLTVKPSPPPY